MSSAEIRGWIFEHYTQTNVVEKYDQVNQRTMQSMNFIRMSMTEQEDTFRQTMTHQLEQWNTNFNPKTLAISTLVIMNPKGPLVK